MLPKIFSIADSAILGIRQQMIKTFIIRVIILNFAHCVTQETPMTFIATQFMKSCAAI